MGFILIKVVALEWPPLSEMNCGSDFGPELPGLLPNPAAEKEHSSFSDVHRCTSFTLEIPAASLHHRSSV